MSALGLPGWAFALMPVDATIQYHRIQLKWSLVFFFSVNARGRGDVQREAGVGGVARGMADFHEVQLVVLSLIGPRC